MAWFLTQIIKAQLDTCSSRPRTYIYFTRKLTAPSNSIIFCFDSCLIETVMAWKIYSLTNTFPGFFCFVIILGQVFCSWGQNWHFFKHLYFRFSLTVLRHSGGILSFQQTFNSPCLLRKSQGGRVPSTCLFRLWGSPGNRADRFIIRPLDSRRSAINNHNKLIDVTASLDRNYLSFTKEKLY